MPTWAAGVSRKPRSRGRYCDGPRVTDAAVVIGLMAWKFNWQRNDYDARQVRWLRVILSSAGPSARGNYAFFEEVPSFRNVGYLIAEIEPTGTHITKHPSTGGLISGHGEIAQLLYEISTPAYYNPDVIAHFDTMQIVQAGEDRVYVSGCRGTVRHQRQGVLQHPRPVQAINGGTTHGFRYRKRPNCTWTQCFTTWAVAGSLTTSMYSRYVAIMIPTQ